MEIWAHRGLSGTIPENTLPAFVAAARLGVTGVEFDVQLTADGVPVVIHDDCVDRTTSGTGKVACLTHAQIESLDAGSWFDARFQGLRIPTLAEVLDFFRAEAPHVKLNVELKPSRPHREELVRRTWTEIVRRELVTRVVVSSFDPGLLEVLRGLAPEAELAVLGMHWRERLARIAEHLNATAVHLSARSVNAAVVREVHQRGWALRVFTVNHPDVARRLSAIGVDGVFTDHPDALRDMASVSRRPAAALSPLTMDPLRRR
jgi:glycerophosphoryl diester phosphodiesterase